MGKKSYKMTLKKRKSVQFVRVMIGSNCVFVVSLKNASERSGGSNFFFGSFFFVSNVDNINK
jgi:hypothetical protein